MDFEDHMAQFERAIEVPGLPARDKLAELKHWFAGLAKVQTAKFHRMMDHEAALKGALKLLHEEYGQRASSAEDMLADAMSKGAIGRKDAEGINVFVGQIEEVYALAAETDRDHDFHRTSLYRAILSDCLPHLKQPWAAHVEKKELRKPSFEDFLKFLATQRKIATRLSELDRDSPRPLRKEAKAEPTQAEEPEEGWETVSRSTPRAPKGAPRETQGRGRAPTAKPPPKREGEGADKPRRQGAPPPCPQCKAAHPLDHCPQFGQLTPKERAAFVKERKRCAHCLKGSHEAGGCFAKTKCYTCLGDHHFLLHEEGAPKASGAPQPRPASA